MQNRLLNLSLGLIFLLIVASGCKRLQIGGGNSPRSWKATLAKVEKEKVDFETMAISGKVHLNLPMSGMENMRASYRINIEDGKRMLIRVSYLIEVARILITRDSIIIQDKFNKKLITCDFSIAESYTGLQADFDMLQDLILGDFHQIPEEVELLTESKDPLIFSGLAAGSEFAYHINPLINKVIKIITKNSTKNQNSEINYSDFQPYGGTEMPLTAKVSVTAPEALTFELEHKKIQINPSKVSFKLSSTNNYEKQVCP